MSNISFIIIIIIIFNTTINTIIISINMIRVMIIMIILILPTTRWRQVGPRGGQGSMSTAPGQCSSGPTRPRGLAVRAGARPGLTPGTTGAWAAVTTWAPAPLD